MCYHADINFTHTMKVETWGELVDALLLRKVAFLLTFFVVFLATYALLAWFDFLPEAPAPQAPTIESPATETALTLSVIDEPLPEALTPAIPVFPDTLVIDGLDRTVSVLNPNSRTVADLDAALLYGVVRHPDSATLDQVGTVLVLGHSSYLPTVLNPNFQAFNGIQHLEFGDTIRLQSGDVEYVYRVDRVYRAKAEDIAVPIAGEEHRLVLATCNSFGSVDDRYIVEAGLLETRTIAG